MQYISIEEGEAVFFTGPNGCGKSTLLRLLAFLERPAAGELHYAGGAEGRKEATLLLQDPYIDPACIIPVSAYSKFTFPSLLHKKLPFSPQLFLLREKSETFFLPACIFFSHSGIEG